MPVLYPEFKYVGFKKELQSPTKIVDASQTALEWETEEEAYVSVYRFNDAVKDLPSLGNLKNVPFYPEFIYFDFDSKDLNLAYADALMLCERLDHVNAHYELFFSGGKGFHVSLHSSQLGLSPMEDPAPIQAFATALAKGLETFDPSIYNKSRVIRCPGSYNFKGGRYKIECRAMSSLEEILVEAKEVGGPVSYDPIFHYASYSPISELVSLWDTANSHKEEIVVSEQEPKFLGSIFVKAGEGERNEKAYTVARRMARRGVPLGDALQIMVEVWNPSYCSPPLGNNELAKVIENAYTKGVNTFVEEGTYAGHIEGLNECFDKVSADFRTRKSGFMTGYEFFDKYTMGFEPGETIMLAGRSGNFKSAIMTNILQRGSKLSKKPAIMFSMEMGPKTLLPRLIQQSERMTKKEVVEALRAGKRLIDFDKTAEDFEYLKFCYLSNLGTEQIVGLINYYKETYGELSAIGFDYLGLFRGCNNNTDRTAKQAAELKTVIAKTAGCPVFCLAQAKQLYEGRSGDVELDRTCVKDSDSALDLADYSIGVWGHWDYPSGAADEEKFICGRFLKSRGCDEDPYGIDPYFGLDLNKSNMRLDNVLHMPTPFSFKQRNGND